MSLSVQGAKLAAGGREVFSEGLVLARDSGVLTLTID
jgi:hypothetical protein